MSEKETKAKEQELRLKVEAFCVAYTSLGEPTFGAKAKSAIAAGYSEKSAKNTASELLRDSAVRLRIKDLNAENMGRNNVSTDKVLRDIEHTRLAALEKGDNATALQCSVWQGKHLAMFTDRYVMPTVEEQRELNEAEQAECDRLANIRLLGDRTDETPSQKQV